jgi:hypothetical protein
MICDADELLNEGDMIGPPGAAQKFHADLFRGVVPFLVVAILAGAYQIFPGIAAAIYFGDDMVDCHVILFLAAVLAAAGITLDDIFASE